MINSPGLTIFESADEILIDFSGTRPNLSAAGFFCEIDATYSGLRLSSETESEVRQGFEQPLTYVRAGDPEHGRKQLWFTTRAAADDLVSKVCAAHRQRNQFKSEYSPYKASFASKTGEWLGVFVTAICISFIGAGAANFGWKTFDPLAVRFAADHQPDLVEQAMLQEKMDAVRVFRNFIDEQNQAQAAAVAYANQSIGTARSFNDFRATLEAANEKMKAREKVIIQMLPEKDQ
jgi:hypothetical protein